MQLHLVDSRAEQLDGLRLADVTDGVADVTVHRELIGEVVLDRLPRGAHVLIMTHDHAEDFALCDAALRLIDPQRPTGQHRTDRLAGEVGCASRRCWPPRVMIDETIAEITSPIGLPGIDGKDPAVIAVSVAAALLTSSAP